MFHATSKLLTCLARRARARQAADHHLAAAHSWQVEQITPGTYRVRDPRFDQLRVRS
jgi:hypothetical protein